MNADNNKVKLKQSDLAFKTATLPHRPRKTKVMLEHELNEIYRLLLDGVSQEEIKISRNISDRNFTKYMQKLRDRIAADQQAKRRDYFLLDLEIAKERWLADKRYLQEIITNPKTPVRDKLVAIRTDMELNSVLLKLGYEGGVFIKNGMQGGRPEFSGLSST